jgi:endoribonuclease Dicer
MLEAYVGAIFIDSDFDFNCVHRFFNTHIEPFFIDMSIYDDFADSHPTTRLSNLMGKTFQCNEWRLATYPIPKCMPGAEKTLVSMVMIHWKIVADSGTRTSSRYARIEAAKRTLDLLEGLATVQYRMEFGCDCVADDKPDEDAGI